MPNATTVAADVLAGAVVARGQWAPVPLIVSLVIATVAFYWAGMIWNDCHDVEEDRAQGRKRPLVTGAIQRSTADRVAWCLAIGGLILVTIVCVVYGYQQEIAAFKLKSLATVVVAIGLVVAVRIYDSDVKNTWLGPWLMGLCRFGSMLLPISIGWWLQPTIEWSTPHLWIIAGGHGLYVAGVTWAARHEAEDKQSWLLPAGWFIAFGGLLAIAFSCSFVPAEWKLRLHPLREFPIIFLLFAIPLIRRAAISLSRPTPMTIQAAIKQAIMSIIFFDALLTLQFGSTSQSITVMALVIPSLLFGRTFRST